MASKRPPAARKPLTKRRLANIATYYLQRHASSIGNVRQVLRRRVRRELAKDADPAEAIAWIEELIVGFSARGLLDDRAYAESKVARDRAFARPPRRTRAALMAKGVAGAIIDQTVRDDGTAEWVAALSLARRRRLGPFRATARDRDSDRRDLAVLGRAGIGFGVAKRVMAMEEPPP